MAPADPEIINLAWRVAQCMPSSKGKKYEGIELVNEILRLNEQVKQTNAGALAQYALSCILDSVRTPAGTKGMGSTLSVRQTLHVLSVAISMKCCSSKTMSNLGTMLKMPHDLEEYDDDMEAFQEACGDAAKSGVCGVVWKKDELAYKCKTCEKDPTCAICVACFRHGNHKGHDYAMIRTGGGCCDCGDGQAWRKEGFCSRHGGAYSENDNPADLMDPDVRSRLASVSGMVGMALWELMDKLGSHFSSEQGVSVDAKRIVNARRLVRWIKRIVNVGDGVRRVVGLEIIANWESNAASRVKPGNPCILWRLLQLDGYLRLPNALSHELHALYYTLITDLVFKRAFLHLFMVNYERFVYTLLRKRVLGLDDDDDDENAMENQRANLEAPPVPAVTLHQATGADDRDDMQTADSDASIDEEESDALNDSVEEVRYGTWNEHEVGNEHASDDSMVNDATVAIEQEDRGNDGDDEQGGDPRELEDLAPTIQSLQNSGVGPTHDESRNMVIDHVADGSNSVNTDYTNRESLAAAAAAIAAVRAIEAAIATPAAMVDNPPPLLSSESDDDSSDWEQIPGFDDDFDTADLEISETHEDDGERSGDILDNFSVQLFTVPALVPVMIQKNGLLDVLINILLALLRRASIPVFSSPHPRKRSRTNIHSSGLRSLDDSATQLPSPEEGREGMGAFSEVNKASPGELQTVGVAEDIQRDSSDISAMEFWYRHQHPLLRDDAELFGNIRSTTKGSSRRSPIISDGHSLEWHKANHLVLDFTNQAKMDLVCWRVMYDLRYILTHVEVSVHLVHMRPDLFQKLIRILTLLQGTNATRRELFNHVETENDHWASAFTLELELFHLVELVVAGFNERIPKNASAPVFPTEDLVGKDFLAGSLSTLPPRPFGFLAGEPSSSQSASPIGGSIASRLRAIRMVREALVSWLRVEQWRERSEIGNRGFQVAWDPVSVHLPLHRLLALLVSEVIKKGGLTLKQAFGFDSDTAGNSESASIPQQALELAEHVVRVQVFMAQMRAGMWRRNGRMAMGQLILYRSVYCVEWFVDLDIFLLQACSILAGSQAIQDLIVDRFALAETSPCSSLNPISYRDVQILAERFNPNVSKAFASQAQKSLVSSDALEVSGSSASAAADVDGSAKDGSARRVTLLSTPSSSRFYGTTPESPRPEKQRRLSLDEYEPVLIEDMLLLFIHISCERARCGMSSAQYLKHKLLHRLAVADQTHSMLLRAVPRRFIVSKNVTLMSSSSELFEDGSVDFDNEANASGASHTPSHQPTVGMNSRSDSASELQMDDCNAIVERVLKEIAIFSRPKEMEQGTYSLKPDAWNDFDPFISHYPQRDRALAEERYAAVRSRLKQSPNIVPEGQIVSRPCSPVMADLLSTLSAWCAFKSGIVSRVFWAGAEMYIAAMKNARRSNRPDTDMNDASQPMQGSAEEFDAGRDQGAQSGASSVVLEIDNALHLSLYLFMVFLETAATRLSHVPRDQIACSIAAMFDIDLQGDSEVARNPCFTDLLDLLAVINGSEEYKDMQQCINRILTALSTIKDAIPAVREFVLRHPVIPSLLQRQQPENDQDQEAAEKEKRAKRMQELRKRQQEALAKMKAQQEAFAARVESDTKKNEPEKSNTAHKNDPVDAEDDLCVSQDHEGEVGIHGDDLDVVCALCRDSTTNENLPIGFIGFAQRSNLAIYARKNEKHDLLYKKRIDSGVFGGAYGVKEAGGYEEEKEGIQTGAFVQASSSEQQDISQMYTNDLLRHVLSRGPEGTEDAARMLTGGDESDEFSAELTVERELLERELRHVDAIREALLHPAGESDFEDENDDDDDDDDVSHPVGVNDRENILAEDGRRGAAGGDRDNYDLIDIANLDIRYSRSANSSVDLGMGASSLQNIDSQRVKEEEQQPYTSLKYLLYNGADGSPGIHIGFCGHYMHRECFESYFSSLLFSQMSRARFEGDHVVRLERGEYLCPVCRRLANVLLPLTTQNDSNINVKAKLVNQAFDETDPRANREAVESQYGAWLKHGFPDILEDAHLAAADASQAKNVPMEINQRAKADDHTKEMEPPPSNSASDLTRERTSRRDIPSALSRVAGRMSVVLDRLENLLSLPWRREVSGDPARDGQDRQSGLTNFLWPRQAGRTAQSTLASVTRSVMEAEAAMESIRSNPAAASRWKVMAPSSLARLLMSTAHTMMLLEIQSRTEPISSSLKSQVDGPLHMLYRACRAHVQHDVGFQDMFKKLIRHSRIPTQASLASRSSRSPRLADPDNSIDPYVVLFSLLVLWPCELRAQDVLFCVRTVYSLNLLQSARLRRLSKDVVKSSQAGGASSSKAVMPEDVTPDENDIVHMAKQSLLFLRRAVILCACALKRSSYFLDTLVTYDLGSGSAVTCLADHEAFSATTEQQEMTDNFLMSTFATDKVVSEFRSLVRLLALPEPEHFLGGLEVDTLISRLCFDDKPSPAKLQLMGLSSHRTLLPIPLRLIQLPTLFQELLESTHMSRCESCLKIPQMPALCLVCGKLLCAYGMCTPAAAIHDDNGMDIAGGGGGTANAGGAGAHEPAVAAGAASPSALRGQAQLGRCFVHAEQCGAGTGIFLVLKLTSVLVLREERRAIWGSPYLDEHGEEDVELRRGKPLFLSEERYRALQRLWLTHGFDHNSRILASTARQDLGLTLF